MRHSVCRLPSAFAVPACGCRGDARPSRGRPASPVPWARVSPGGRPPSAILRPQLRRQVGEGDAIAPGRSRHTSYTPGTGSCPSRSRRSWADVLPPGRRTVEDLSALLSARYIERSAKWLEPGRAPAAVPPLVGTEPTQPIPMALEHHGAPTACRTPGLHDGNSALAPGARSATTKPAGRAPSCRILATEASMVTPPSVPVDDTHCELGTANYFGRCPSVSRLGDGGRRARGERGERGNFGRASRIWRRRGP